MENNQQKIEKLLQKLKILYDRQDSFKKEMDELKLEIFKLKNSPVEETKEKPAPPTPTTDKQPVPEKAVFTDASKEPVTTGATMKIPKRKSDLEKFIGENLINKIGILITVLGVGIGAKYAIENEMISPLTRIILGYLLGAGLLGFALKLKKNYANFSAVLLSGSMAIFYFITYSAYAFYELIPQELTFLFMLVFTCFTVLAAIKYDRQVIAHIGLVGAYAVPFLLSDGSGKVVVLFSYMALINIGILFIAFKKYWKSLNYASFIITWLIYASWFFSSYEAALHFGLAAMFATTFFLIFYVSFLAYKIIQKEHFEIQDVLLLLANSFIFFGIGYGILNSHPTGSEFLGIFCLGNAIIHFAVSMLISKQKLADKNIFYLVMGLVLVFLTIAIPIQLDGNWVTLLWCFEAALLFWIGRTKQVGIYEHISYPLMVLAFASLVHDWNSAYGEYFPEDLENRINPILNIHFLTSLLFIVAFGFIVLIKIRTINSSKTIPKLMNYMIPGILLLSTYFAFYLEIANYWSQLYIDSAVQIMNNGNFPSTYRNYALKNFKIIWLLNYSIGFLTILSFLNLEKFRNRNLAKLNLTLNSICIFAFLVTGLLAFSSLRNLYINQSNVEYYVRDWWHLGIRYFSFIFVAVLLYVTSRYKNTGMVSIKYNNRYDLLLHTALLWLLSSELIHWMDLYGYNESYKLGLSILWGVYSLLLIALGIWKNKKYLRVGAIILFGLTLLKLFVYDISHLDTIAKTIVFVSLGILLLIISFLYNKYKHIISNEKEINP